MYLPDTKQIARDIGATAVNHTWKSKNRKKKNNAQKCGTTAAWNGRRCGRVRGQQCVVLVACCLFVRHSIVRSFVRLSSVCCTWHVLQIKRKRDNKTLEMSRVCLFVLQLCVCACVCEATGIVFICTRTRHRSRIRAEPERSLRLASHVWFMTNCHRHIAYTIYIKTFLLPQ